MKLSISLPSLFPQSLLRVLSNVQATTHEIDYEFLAVTPFEVSGPNIRWIREDVPRGNVAAHAAAYAAMTGDIMVALTDDVVLADDWAGVALAALEEREAASGDGRPFCLGLHQSNFAIGTVFGIYFPFFPFVRASTLRRVGGYYDPAYIAEYGDPDLGLRVWSAGGRCERTPLPLVTRGQREGHEDVEPPAKTSASQMRDMQTFAERWRERYGKGWSTKTTDDFNLNIDPMFELVVGEDYSVFFNDPLFKILYDRYAQNCARWDVRGAGVLRR